MKLYSYIVVDDHNTALTLFICKDFLGPSCKAETLLITK